MVHTETIGWNSIAEGVSPEFWIVPGEVEYRTAFSLQLPPVVCEKIPQVRGVHSQLPTPPQVVGKNLMRAASLDTSVCRVQFGESRTGRTTSKHESCSSKPVVSSGSLREYALTFEQPIDVQNAEDDLGPLPILSRRLR